MPIIKTGVLRVSDAIESRLAKLEREFALLKISVPRDRSNWLSEISGSFRGDPDFAEIVRLAKEMRDAEQPEKDWSVASFDSV